MYKTMLNLAVILSATLLTACGGGGSGENAANALTPTQPQNTAFDAAKQYRREILLSKSYNQMFRPYDISVNGHVIFRVSGDIQSAFKETDVDFATKTGHGSIEGFGRYGDLFLEEAQINPFWKQTGSPSTSITHGKITDTKGSRNLYYLLNLYGDHAEEIAGYAEMEGKESIGFHGTRGDISN